MTPITPELRPRPHPGSTQAGPTPRIVSWVDPNPNRNPNLNPATAPFFSTPTAKECQELEGTRSARKIPGAHPEAAGKMPRSASARSASGEPLAKRQRTTNTTSSVREGGSLFRSLDPTAENNTLPEDDDPATDDDEHKLLDSDPPTEDDELVARTSTSHRGTSKPVAVPAPTPSKPSKHPSMIDLTADDDDEDSSRPPPPLPTAALLSHLSCPICLGSPTPLALTACGHAFCGPCLHAALLAGPALTPSSEERGGFFGPGGSRGGTGSNRGAGSRGAAPTEERGEGELDKRCPVCRVALYGGWGKSLRGLVMRMVPAPLDDA